MNKPLVRVVWKDAHSSSVNAYAEHEIPHSALVIETVGWLLKQDSDGVSVANEYCADATYRGYTFVPAGLLVKVEPLVKSKRERRPSPAPAAQTQTEQ
jgi:hypothetical protein